MHMRIYFLTFTIIAILFACSQSNSPEPFVSDNFFINVSPSNINGEITSLKFINTLDGIATTSSGTVIQTNDGGNTWIDTTIFEQDWLGNLYFNSYGQGFCTGIDSLVFMYSNASWSHYNFPINNIAVSCIFTLSDKNIYATTFRDENNLGHLLHSENSGTTWDTVYSAFADFKQVLFLNSETGFVITHNENKVGLLKTNDGGKSWYTRIPSTYGTFFDNTAQLVKLIAINNNNLVLIGRGKRTTEGMLFTSDDAGDNWEIELLPQALNDVTATNDHLYLVGDELFAVQWPINLSAINTPSYITKTWYQYKKDSCFYLNDRGSKLLQYHDIKGIEFTNSNTGYIFTNSKSLIFKINIVE